MPLSASPSRRAPAAGTAAGIPGPSSSTAISIVSSVDREAHANHTLRAGVRVPTALPHASVTASFRSASTDSLDRHLARDARRAQAARGRGTPTSPASLSLTTFALTRTLLRHRVLQPAAHQVERATQQPGNVHLRDPDVRGDLRLGEPLEEAQLDDPALPLVERVEPRLDEQAVLDLGEPAVVDAEDVLHRLVVRLAAERLGERPSRVGLRGLQRLDDLVLVGAGRLRELRDRRGPAELRRLRLDRSREPDAELLDPARHVERPRAVAEVALDLADDGRHRVRGELHLALGVEALDREQQADRADLDEVLLRLAAARRTVRRGFSRAACSGRRAARGPARRPRGTPRSGRRSRRPGPRSCAARGRVVETTSSTTAPCRRRAPRTCRRGGRGRAAARDRRAVPAGTTRARTGGPTAWPPPRAARCRRRAAAGGGCRPRAGGRRRGRSGARSARRRRRGRAGRRFGTRAAPGTRRCARRRAAASSGRLTRARSAAARASSRSACSEKTRSSSVISKMRRMCGSAQTMLTLPPEGRSRLTAPSRTPSVIESMKVASDRSTTRPVAPPSRAAVIASRSSGAVWRSA